MKNEDKSWVRGSLIVLAAMFAAFVLPFAYYDKFADIPQWVQMAIGGLVAGVLHWTAATWWPVLGARK